MDPLTPRLQTLRLCARHAGLLRIAATLLSTVIFCPRGPEELMLELDDADPAVEMDAGSVDIDGDEDTITQSMALAELDRVLHGLSGLSKVRVRAPPA